MSLLELEHVTAHYGSFLAADDISLHLDEGELVAIIGSNGVGKSTILKTIAGLLRPTKGVVRFQGREIQHLDAHKVARLGITLIPDDRCLFDSMTVAENLELGSYLSRKKKNQLLERALGLFPALAPLQSRRAGSLSGGERQQLSMAMGMMSEPLVYLIDEPSLGLSPLVTEALFEAISRMNEVEATSILLVEQDAYQALRASSRTYVVESHRIVIHDDSSKLLKSDAIRKSYLGVL